MEPSAIPSSKNGLDVIGGGVVQDGADQQSQEFGVVQQTGHHAQQLLLVVLEHSRPERAPGASPPR